VADAPPLLDGRVEPTTKTVVRAALRQLVDLPLDALSYPRRNWLNRRARPVVAPEGSSRRTGFVR